MYSFLLNFLDRFNINGSTWRNKDSLFTSNGQGQISIFHIENNQKWTFKFYQQTFQSVFYGFAHYFQTQTCFISLCLENTLMCRQYLLKKEVKNLRISVPYWKITWNSEIIVGFWLFSTGGIELTDILSPEAQSMLTKSKPKLAFV